MSNQFITLSDLAKLHEDMLREFWLALMELPEVQRELALTLTLNAFGAGFPVEVQ